MKQYAFNRLVVDLTDKLYRFAYRIVTDDAVAKDAVQDTFVKLWQKRKALRKIKNIEAFAYVILKNRCLDILKSQAYANGMEHFEENRLFALDNYDKLEEVQLVKQLIDRLPVKQKMVLQLRETEGKSFAEIAEIMQLEEGNVRVLLSRSRKQLKTELDNIYAYESKG